jgi:TRAP-type mannitol/chloroaromatic compound transport system substrate-binding protein
MCNVCLIEDIKVQANSRRSFFAKAAAAGAAALAASTVTSRSSLAQSSGKAVDLTHTFDDKFPTFGGKPGMSMEKIQDFKKDGYTIFRVTYE